MQAENIVRLMIESIVGEEEAKREGLRETPKRVAKAWKELFDGYHMDAGELVTVFEEVNGYDQIVLLRNIEFYSFCEHHLLPFIGRGHVAYLPGKKVIGVSKLARILDFYAHRLQIQERIGQQVVEFLSKELESRGAACILEAKHLCMSCRGVAKQHSVMVTSSLAGVFKENASARAELMSLIALGDN